MIRFETRREARERKKETFWGGDLHPWRRWAAKQIDNLVVGLPILLLVSPVIVSWVPGLAGFIDRPIGAALLGTACMVIAEPVMLAAANSPGRALFGIRVRMLDGERPTLRVAFERTAWLWVLGLGVGVPLLAAPQSFFAYKRLQKVGWTRWDEKARTVVTHSRLGWLRYLGCAVVMVALGWLMWLGVSSGSAAS